MIHESLFVASATHNCTVVILCTDYGDILLIDGTYWIALCSSDLFKRCCTLREAVLTGLCEVVSNFEYMAEFKIFKEYFYC